MESLKKHYDRVILIAVAVITVAVSVLLAMKTFGFADRFHQKNPAKGEELRDPNQKRTERATGHFGAESKWTIPEMEGQPGKRLELFRSVPLVEKSGTVEIVDLRAPGSEMLRPLMSNQFLANYDLDYFRSDVGRLDPDRDGFTNEEEFVWGPTNPKDAKEFPPYTKHLNLKEMTTVPYTLKFNGKSGETYTVRRTDFMKKSFFIKLNVPWVDKKGGDGGRFTALKYTPKEQINPRTQVKEDVSELEIKDTMHPGMTIILVRGKEYPLPFKYAVFRYYFPPWAGWEHKVQEGIEFSLPNKSDVTYKLESVESDVAKISLPGTDGGNPKTIEIRPR